MIASQQRDGSGVAELQEHEELEGLDTVVASIHEVAHEDVALLLFEIAFKRAS